MWHILIPLLPLLCTATGYTLLLKNKGDDGWFCVTNDAQETVVAIPNLGITGLPQSINEKNTFKPWNVDWNLQNLFIKGKYWILDSRWRDLHQIAIPADAANYMALDNFEGDKDKKEIVFSVLAKLVTIELKVLLGQKRREKSYKLIIDSYNMTSAVNKRLVLEVCEVNQTCTRLDYQSIEILESGTRWVHLSITLFISNANRFNVAVQKFNDENIYYLQDKTEKFGNGTLVQASANTKSSNGAGDALFKLHQGKILWPMDTKELQILSKTYEPSGNEHVCLHVTWHKNLPHEVFLNIDSLNIKRSRSYKLFEIAYDMEIRLEENITFKDKYVVTLSFKTYGGLSSVQSCSKRGALQIVYSEESLRGCQLLIQRKGQVSQIAFESSNCSVTSSLGYPKEISTALPEICSKIEVDYHLNGFCNNLRVCNHLRCFCSPKNASYPPTLSSSAKSILQHTTRSTPDIGFSYGLNDTNILETDKEITIEGLMIINLLTAVNINLMTGAIILCTSLLKLDGEKLIWLIHKKGQNVDRRFASTEF